MNRPPPDRRQARKPGPAPGVILCAAVATLSAFAQTFEARILGRAWLEALVLAILLGTAIRTAWSPGPRWKPGIDFSAKILLEVAVILLGATVSGGMILATGPLLLAGIAATVGLSLAVSYALGRMLGLPWRMATLIACGNSICGNSAIAAVAPVIGADSEDVAASIAFTAVLGVAVVLALPALAIAWGMTPRSFGILAGLTVYAVPQVLAATAPISSVSAQVGTVVKLARVLMLGPVTLCLSLIPRRSGSWRGAGVPAIHRLVPWFIIGFLALMAARSGGLIPGPWLATISRLATWLTIVSMAALGLGVDVRVIARAGPRVIAVVTLSLLALGGIAMILIRGLGLW